MQVGSRHAAGGSELGEARAGAVGGTVPGQAALRQGHRPPGLALVQSCGASVCAPHLVSPPDKMQGPVVTLEVPRRKAGWVRGGW